MEGGEIEGEELGKRGERFVGADVVREIGLERWQKKRSMLVSLSYTVSFLIFFLTFSFNFRLLYCIKNVLML